MSDINITIPSAGHQAVNTEQSIKAVATANTAQSTSDMKTDNTHATQQQQSEAVQSTDKASETKSEIASEVTAEDISKTVDDMNSLLQEMKRNISFSVDEDLGDSLIIVKDSESDEVIRQIPSEELVVLRKKMDDVAGILFDTKV